jgi:hypothetical protein
VPLYRDPRSDMPVTQFDMKYVESAGLVKFDFLGLKTLSVLQRAVDLFEACGSRSISPRCRWDDTAVYDAAPARRHRRGVPAGIRGDADARGMKPDQFSGHHRARLALPARPDGQYPDVRPEEERQESDRISAPELEPSSRKPTASSSIRNR